MALHGRALRVHLVDKPHDDDDENGCDNDDDDDEYYNNGNNYNVDDQC